MYRRILVPLDGSELAEQVLPYVGALAKKLGSQVNLLRSFSPASSEIEDPSHGHFRHQIDAGMHTTISGGKKMI